MDTDLNQIDTSRLEAFSDGVIAIIITLMILAIQHPKSANLSEWIPIIPTLFTYILSFVVLAIYWNNHHHLLRATKNISTGVMWANMFLLFCLSLVPIVTAWMGEHYAEKWPVVIYSFVGLLSGVAYFILSRSIVKANPGTPLAEAIGKDHKGVISLVLYILALMAAFIHPYVAYLFLASAAVWWIVPDERLTNV